MDNSDRAGLLFLVVILALPLAAFLWTEFIRALTGIAPKDQ